MKIKITDNKPRNNNDGDISHLVGETFEVISIDHGGHYIKYGSTGMYVVYEDEFEVVEG